MVLAYRLITTIDYQADVDNLRYDDAAKRVYVDYGDGEKAAIGMVDATTNQRLPDEYKTGSHAESFQLAEKGPEMYVNLPQLEPDRRRQPRYSRNLSMARYLEGEFPNGAR